MLDQARARNAEANREGRLELRLGSLEDPPAAGGSFDKVCSANVVQFFPDRAAVFHKIYSMLKPKGVAATTYMPRNKNPRGADVLWTEPHLSQQMLQCHLDQDSELASRPLSAIDAFIDWIDGKFNLTGSKSPILVVVQACMPIGLRARSACPWIGFFRQFNRLCTKSSPRDEWFR
jgi:SAM-dependent methyltransferase